MLKRATKPPNGWKEEKADTEYSFWIEKNIAYLAFQGSMSVVDWIFNLILIPCYRKFGFHYGMYMKYSYVADKIETFIKKNKEKEIIIVGHSQGAGIGLIALIFMKIKYPQLNIKAVLFACPKIINWIGFLRLRKFKDYITLYEVRTDIVTKIVPINFRLGKRILLGPKKPIWKWKFTDHFPKKYKKYL